LISGGIAFVCIAAVLPEFGLLGSAPGFRLLGVAGA
jgi:hypothetical protein